MKTKFYILLVLIFFFQTKNLLAKTEFFLEGKKLYNQKKFSESKFQFEKDIVFNPKNERSYLYLAKIFKEEKNQDLQEQNLNTVMVLNPKNEEAIYLLLLLKLDKSDIEGTESLLEKFKKVCTKLCNNQNELIAKLKTLKDK